MTREEFCYLVEIVHTLQSEWDTRFKILREYDRLATERDDLQKRLEDATGEIAHLKDTRQDPFDQIEVLRAELENSRQLVLDASSRLAPLESDAERLANFIKHAQKLGLFRGSAHISAQAIDVLDKHQQTTF